MSCFGKESQWIHSQVQWRPEWIQRDSDKVLQDSENKWWISDRKTRKSGINSKSQSSTRIAAAILQCLSRKTKEKVQRFGTWN